MIRRIERGGPEGDESAEAGGEFVADGGESGEDAARTAAFLERAREILRDTFGYDAFREGQERVLRALATGEDLVVVMPTGSGKSICYQVPALISPGVTLVVSPLIALMKDQVDGLQLRGVPVTFVNSSLSYPEQLERLEGIRAGEYRLVYVAPERFRNRAFCRAVAQLEVALLAVDEAHCISQWGHDFRPDYRRLRDVRAALKGVPCIALTATATPEVRRDIVRELAMQKPVEVVTGFDRPNLSFRVQRVRGDSQKREALEDFLRRELLPEGAPSSISDLPSGIVYTGTRRHAEEVAAFLAALPWTASPCGEAIVKAYHAGLENDERREVQEDFMEGRLPWVVATNAFGMGVDKSDIRFVVHYDLPGSVEAYYQEVGRAGRDGEAAICLLLFSQGDRNLQEFFIEGSNPSRETIERVWDFLWRLGENPIFRSLQRLGEAFQDGERSSKKVNPMAFRSAVVILERAGGLERLDHYENLAEIRPQRTEPWEVHPYGEKARVKGRLWNALRQVFENTAGDPASIRLETWAAELDMEVDSLKRGVAQLVHDGWIHYVPPFRGRAIRLPGARRSPEDLGVDFEALQKRRRKDEEQLAAMLSYARRGSCRRDLILEHFGEAIPEVACGRCDSCDDRASSGHGVARPLDEYETTVVRKVLSGVARARGRCGRGRIVKMLAGSQARDVTELGFDRLSTHGILREVKQELVRDILDQLELAGCVRAEGDRFPVVHLTELGQRVMMNEETVEIAIPQLQPVARVSRRAGAGGYPEADEEEYDDELFQRLRHLRREIAAEFEVPAYRVFNDRTLKAMTRLRPADEAELLGVPGVGERTLKLFGEAFLREIRGGGG